MSTLYELTNQYQQLLELESEIDEQTFIDTLQSIDEAIEDKAENLAKVIKEMEATITTIANEVSRLQSKKQAVANRVSNLKTYLQGEMEKVNKTKIKGELFTVNIQNNPPSLRVNRTDNIPKDFFIEQEPTLDKAKLKKAIKGGDAIDGVELVQTRGVRIR